MDAGKTELDDAEMIKSPLSWPAWPFLPLIHRETHEPGVIYCWSDETLLIVIHANMFDLKGKRRDDVKTTKYESAEAIAREWRVD